MSKSTRASLRKQLRSRLLHTARYLADDIEEEENGEVNLDRELFYTVHRDWASALAERHGFDVWWSAGYSDFDSVAFEGDGWKLLNPEPHTTYALPPNPTWLDIWKAIDKAVRDAGGTSYGMPGYFWVESIQPDEHDNHSLVFGLGT